MGRRRGPGDAGFTLPELLVAISILGVIVTALGAGVISWLRHSQATTDQLTLSHDVQISAAYFARDVASTGTRAGDVGSPLLEQSVHLTPDTTSCAPPESGTEWVVGLTSDRWEVTTGPTPAASRKIDTVVYYLTAPVGGLRELRRATCRGAVPATGWTTVAHHVKAEAGTLKPICAEPTDCEAAAVPKQMTLTFTVAASATPGAGLAPNDIEVTLTGERRQS
jgi:prepilin-type N-terminal cleavage/methylation domain-containing protein